MNIRVAIGVCVLVVCGGCHSHRAPQASVSEVVMENDVHKERILRGVYPGEGAWRWTGPEFAFSLDQPAAGKQAYLELDFTVPDELMQKPEPVTVIAKINGTDVGRQTYARAGRSPFAAGCEVCGWSWRPFPPTNWPS